MSKLKLEETIKNDNFEVKLYLPETGKRHLGTNRLKSGCLSPADGNLIAHKGDEYLMVISGQLKVTTEEEEWTLNPGDFHYMPANIGHLLETVSEEESYFTFIVIDK
jgi:mannose-6-phosphate isomerase-like protein (cupin superfamily)